MVIGAPISSQCQRTEFPPCQKKSSFHPNDGPTFQLDKPKDSELVGYCKLTNLQTVDPGDHLCHINICSKLKVPVGKQSFLGTVRLKTILRFGQDSILCKGVMSFPAPIVKNFPKLKIKNNENS
jgi:hypothetical protein